MGLFDRVERKLDRAINGAFARAFKAEVQPVEIASAMRKAMDDRAAVVSRSRTVVPNAFTIELDPEDHGRLTQYEDVLVDELIASAQEHAESQKYHPGGPFQVEFVVDDGLDTGVFRIRPRTTSEAPPAARHNRAPEHRPVTSLPPRDDAQAGFRRRNDPNPPEATAPAEGSVGMASNAASAATGAAAGTAAAGRAGDVWARPEDDASERERLERRRQDLAAWPDDEDEAPAPPRRPRRSPGEEMPATRANPMVPSSPPPTLDPSTRPWLDLDGEAYPLLSAITVIGRDAEAEVTLTDAGISRRHCEIRVTHDGPHLVVGLRDLGSTNGTYVNGEKVTTQRLDEGDRVTVGRQSFTVHLRRH